MEGTLFTDFGTRLLKAYRVLNPGKNEVRGPQIWFRRVMSLQTHLKPSKATVSRWVNGQRGSGKDEPWRSAWETLARLEDDARLVLRAQMREFE